MHDVQGGDKRAQVSTVKRTEARLLLQNFLGSDMRQIMVKRLDETDGMQVSNAICMYYADDTSCGAGDANACEDGQLRKALAGLELIVAG